jgi:hypothetical protein
MRIVQSGNFQFGLLVATTLSLSMMPTGGNAYTADQQQACTGDAFRLCSGAIPDVDQVTACMVAKRSQLSPGCRAFFRDDPQPVADADAPLNIRPAARRYKPHRIRRPVT